MIPEFDVKPKLLGNTDLSEIQIKTTIKTKHKDLNNRLDNYWQAYIVKSKSATQVLVTIDLKDHPNTSLLSQVDSIWIDIPWTNYGPFGRMRRNDGFVIPITFPIKDSTSVISDIKGISILPKKTHILGILDDSFEAIEKYTKPLIKDRDIITIGETPLAIMQGRYTLHNNIQISFCRKLKW